MKEKNKDIQKYYLQFDKGSEFPIFVRFEDEEFYFNSLNTLEPLGFKKVEEEVYSSLMKSKSKCHLLNIVEASMQVAKMINTSSNGLSQFGSESVSSHKNYQVYKYKGSGLMVFSPFNNIWELGTTCDLTKEIDSCIFSVMINRFLALTLAEYGVASFWGVPIEEGVVVMNQKKSKSEIVMIDVENMKVLSFDGIKDIKNNFQIIRLDPLIKSETKTLRKEELFSFLMTHSAYLSYFGPSHTVKGLIYQVLNFAQGRIYPEENFLPRISDSESESEQRTGLPLAS